MTFSLSSILKNMSLGSNTEKSVLGIDIGASSIKIVQLRASRGVAILETYGEIALGPYGKQPIGKAVKIPPTQIAAALTDLMREANATTSISGISISFAASLVTVIEVPNIDDESLKRVIPIEARKYIPLPVSEVQLDWFIIPKQEGEDSAFDRLREKSKELPKGAFTSNKEILLVAINNAILAEYQTITSDTGIKADFYEIEIFSAIRSVLGHGLAPVIVVDLGAATTKIYVVERGIVRLTHLVTHGGQHMTETLARSLGWEFEKAERVKRERGLNSSTAYSVEENERIKQAMLSTLTRLFSEVNKVLLSYGQRYNKNVARVILTGGGASLPGLAPLAKESLSAEVELANPFAHTEAPAFLENVLRDIGPGFSVSVGLALRKLKHS